MLQIFGSMKIPSDQLIKDLLIKIGEATEEAKGFKLLNSEQLNFKRNRDAWSILECVEHLNLYGDYYLEAIEKSMSSQKNNSGLSIFKSGIIGNYFANLMMVKDGKIKKMRSPKDKNPANSQLTSFTIDRFLKQQEKLVSLLHQAVTVDLTKTKTSISISRHIKLRLGDTFRFFVYHIERHILQAKRNL